MWPPTAVVVSRWTRAGDTFDAASEIIIFSNPFSAPETATAALVFDDDGLLFAAFGDDSATATESTAAQDSNTLAGAIVRVDIASLDTLGIVIPPDNPSPQDFGWSGSQPTRTWAIGVRHPTGAFVSDTGRLWLADQGVAAISEVVSPPVTVSSAGATTGASQPGRATSLLPTRDFSQYSLCAESRSWPGVRQFLRNGAAFAGGLGALMTTEHQSYMCFKGHACLADVGASALDHMCYLYSEVDHTFRPWGFNSELRLW